MADAWNSVYCPIEEHLLCIAVGVLFNAGTATSFENSEPHGVGVDPALKFSLTQELATDFC
jgi:hypothetical protein